MMSEACANETTARLREDDPPSGLADTEAICSACCLAFYVGDSKLFDWGVCPDCFAGELRAVGDE